MSRGNTTGIDFIRRSGLMPVNDYMIVDGQSQYRDPFIKSKPIAPSNRVMENPTQFGEVDPLKEATPLVEKSKMKKKRNSIEGDTVLELMNNIIKEKPPTKLVIKAFSKMVEMINEQRDEEFFAEFQ